MTLVIAHRGASAYKPENTLEAFRLAVEMRADGVELDVHGTADRQLIVNHDPKVGGRALKEMTLADIRASENGNKMPALPEALDVLRKLEVFVEVKTLDPALDEVLFDNLRAGPRRGDYQIHSFDHRIVQRLSFKQKDLTYGVLSVSIPVHAEQLWRDAGASVLWQDEANIDEPLLELAHHTGCKVVAWTVDDVDRMRELEAMGVDGICTNKPDIGRQTLT